MSLRKRIVDHINLNRGTRYTNSDLAAILDAPQPSVRRASLDAMLKGEIADGGPATYNAGVVTYVAVDVN